MQPSFTYDCTGGFEAAWQSLPFGDNPSPMAEGGASQHHFTGKLHDNESQLDYFQARFSSETLGRFLSPDPLLNSGRPTDPQSWNRYSYVRNNPLGRIDPTGLYDFSQTCGKTDSACQANQKRFNDSVAEARKLLKTLDPKSAEAKALSKALGAIGSLNDKNGVTIGFGATQKGGLAETDGMHIAIDYNKVDNLMDRQAMAMNAPNADVEDAGIDVHEGTHVANNERYGEGTDDEAEAYRAESYTSQAGNSNSVVNVWNTSWAAGPDREILRQQAIQTAADRSKAGDGAPTPPKKDSP